jgi:predicted transcriptional regulator
MSNPPSIKARREALGIKQANLAARTGTNICALSYIERGIKNHHYSASTKRRVEMTLARIERNTRYRRKRRNKNNVAAIVDETRP